MKQINYFMIVLVIFTIVSDVLLLDERKHKKRQKYVKSYYKAKFKKVYNHQIIEGTRVRYADYPFVASLLLGPWHMCGGSIISDSVILTAGHCVADNNGRLLQHSDFTVVVGDGKAVEEFKVSKLVLHEEFDIDELLNDIGLVVLKGKVSRPDHDGIITLDRQPVDEDLNTVHATVLGWAAFINDEGLKIHTFTDELFRINVYAISLSKCREYHKGIDNRQICFSSPSRRGNCEGDSGGPLVMRKNSKLVQIGLISYGDDCNKTTPEVYTRISSYYMWIQKKLAKLKVGKLKE